MSRVRGDDRSATVPPRARILVALAFVLVLLSAVASRPPEARSATIYWGSYIKGDTYGFDDAPFDSRSIDAFEADAGKGVSIVHWGQPWVWSSNGGYQEFPAAEAEKVRLRGAIPMITWTSTNQDAGNNVSQPFFRLSNITSGTHDAYIKQWADDAKAWGHPVFVRFDPEMNGDWYNWSEVVNGNGSGDFVAMWRHVVSIFRQEGADNVTWVWAPNRTWLEAPISLAELYPGGSYVDWAGMSAYNWGTNPAKRNNVWQGFGDVFKDTYRALLSVAPGKPIMVAETASSEYGGSKAAWITDGLRTQLPQNYPQIKAFVWFNWNAKEVNGRMDWVIESSNSAQEAFRSGIASTYFDTGSFSNLPTLAPVPLPPATNPAGTSGGSGGTGGGSSGGGSTGGGSSGGSSSGGSSPGGSSGGTAGGTVAAAGRSAKFSIPTRQTLRSILVYGLKVKLWANPHSKATVRIKVGRSVAATATRRLGAARTLVFRVRFSAAVRKRLLKRTSVKFVISAYGKRATATVRRT